ncbi:MAG: Ig-like domain-containing protein [Bradymonadales bacterium]|nr:Ig-like domain-containing protein [Bradymonadales bacterium]
MSKPFCLLKPRPAFPLVMALLAIACELDGTDLTWQYQQELEVFRVADCSPTDGASWVPLNQPVIIRFNRYLDPDSFHYFDAVIVSSGSISAAGLSRYNMTERTLTFYPTRNYRSELVYTVTLNPDTVRSIAGSPLVVPFSLHFQSGQAGTVDQNRIQQAISFAASIRPTLERRCHCHDLDHDLAPLTHDGLVGVPSLEWEGRMRVVPFDPPRSYLMHKILPDYPQRRFGAMPPGWSGDPPLEPPLLLEIERWIATGARP